MYIDSHCHLDMILEQDQGQTIKNILDQANKNSVSNILCISVNTVRWQKMYELCIPYLDQIFLSAGIHPCYVDKDKDFDTLNKQAIKKEVIAIGETGLDFYYGESECRQQQDSFIKHIELANRLKKPLIVHTRGARKQTIDILKSEQANKCSGIMHCFTEDIDMAKKAVDLGFYISFSGIITFKNASELRDVVNYLPLDKILIETDAPYLAPVPYRGKVNQPSYVHLVAEQIANIKKVSPDQVAKQSFDNFTNLFCLDL